VARVVVLLVPAILGCAASTDAPAQEVDPFVLSSIAAAEPLLLALEGFRSERGRYPQYLDDLVPDHMTTLPAGTTAEGGKQAFVYNGQERSFELFFLGAGGQSQFLYRSNADYPERLEPGPYTRVRRIEGWGWYRLVPMREVPILREWRGRVSLNRKVIPLSFVADGERLKEVWEDWGLDGPVPEIDFERRLFIVVVARSSLVKCMGPVVDDGGDLKPNVVATPDYPDFWSYALCLIDRAGIRTVGGVPF
jgi:hypothetical protein